MSLEIPDALRLRNHKTIQAHRKGGILAVDLTQDSQYLLACGQDSSLSLWNPWKGLCIKRYEAVHHGPVSACAFSADRSKFVSVGPKDSNGYIWDNNTGRIVRRIGNHPNGGIDSCQLIADDNVLITGSADRTVAFWDVRNRDNRRPIQLLSEAADAITKVLWVPTGQVLTSSLDGFLRSYDLRKGQMFADFLHSPITGFSLTHDSGAQCVLVTCLGAGLRLLDRANEAHNETAILNVFLGGKNDTQKLHSCLDKSDSVVMSPTEDGNLIFWDIGTDDPEKKIREIRHCHGDSNANGIVPINNLQKRQFQETSASESIEMTEHSFITFGQDGRIKIWDCMEIT